MKKNEWIESHVCCPKCGSMDVVKTEKELIILDVDNYSDTINSAVCNNCMWKGMVKNLLPVQQDNVSAEIRTMDKDNEVFVSAEDFVRTLRDFGSNLIPRLENEQARSFAQHILTEIIKVFISCELQHRKKKVEVIEEIQNDTEIEIDSHE